MELINILPERQKSLYFIHVHGKSRIANHKVKLKMNLIIDGESVKFPQIRTSKVATATNEREKT